MTVSLGTKSLMRRATSLVLENLETRRMLSHSLSQSIYDPAPTSNEVFGSVLATKGDLALIGAPGRDNNVGQVTLVDTATNTVVRTFTDANGGANDSFGSAVAFIGASKIAIGAVTAGPGDDGQVFVYDNAADTDPLVIDSPYSTPSTFNGFGSAIADYNGNVLASTSTTGVGNSNGDVTLFNSDDGSVIRSYNNYGAGTEDQLGTSLASNGSNILMSMRDNDNGGEMIVLEVDGSNGNLIRTYHDPLGANPSFGLVLQYSGGSVFANSALGVTQFNDSDGSFVHTFTADGMGVAFSVSGNNLFAGAPGVLDGNSIQQGAAYVFDVSAQTLTDTVNNPTPMADYPNDGQGDIFGNAVAATSAGGFIVADQYDDDGGAIDAGGVYAFDEAVIPPVNQPPDASVASSLATSVRLQDFGFTGSFTDPDSGDTHDVMWDFGDGTIIAFHSSTDPGALTPTHAYAATGTYNVTFTVRDNSLATDSASVSQSVAAVAVEGNDLWVGGTSGVDNIEVRNSSQQSKLAVQFNNTLFDKFVASGKIYVLGGAGADTLLIGPAVIHAGEIYGDAGDDTIYGGGGDDFIYGGADNDDVRARGANDVVLGQAGNDLVTGGEGRDILIGGAGSDTVKGNADDDVLISGTTSFDNNRPALDAINSEWQSGHTYAQRIANITNGTGTPSRANGSFFLVADSTVLNDGAADTLAGGQGEDWFFYNKDVAGVKDKITDLQGNETSADVD